MALTLAIFQLVGTVLFCKKLLKMMVMFGTNADASCLRTKPGNLSCPGAVVDLIKESAF